MFVLRFCKYKIFKMIPRLMIAVIERGVVIFVKLAAALRGVASINSIKRGSEMSYAPSSWHTYPHSSRYRSKDQS